MKKILLLVLAMPLSFSAAKAQTAEVTQLILNIEKLSEFRKILSELKAGYEILFKGYNTIKDLSEGNFKLHQAYLDGLLEVSPAVKNYGRVAQIIEGQLTLVKEYRQAYQSFQSSGKFSAAELAYMDKVYSGLTGSALENLTALTSVLTPKTLRASDQERLLRIDALYENIQDQLSFLRHFNSNAALLSAQRSRELDDTRMMQELFDLTP